MPRYLGEFTRGDGRSLLPNDPANKRRIVRHLFGEFGGHLADVFFRLDDVDTGVLIFEAADARDAEHIVAETAGFADRPSVELRRLRPFRAGRPAEDRRHGRRRPPAPLPLEE